MSALIRCVRWQLLNPVVSLINNVMTEYWWRLVQRLVSTARMPDNLVECILNFIYSL